MSYSFTRRDFLRLIAAGAAFAAVPWKALAERLSPPLARRALGKTGVQVPILGFGTAQSGTELSVEEGARLFTAALERGINYFDTAPEFAGYGKAQVQLGHAFKERRNEVFLATKCAKAKADEAMKLLESNLRELQTDHVDLIYVHSLGDDMMDLKVITGPGGVMEFLEKARREGLARFVGVTGHNRPDRFLPILRDYDLDVMMNCVNFVDRHTYNFEEKVWPVAAQRNVGLVAMKVFGGSQHSKDATARLPVEHHHAALRYALSLPNVACAVVGMKSLEELERNLAWARGFTPLDEQELASLRDLGRSLAAEWKDHLGVVA